MEIDQNEKSENYEYDGDNKHIKNGVPIEHLRHTAMPSKNLLHRNNTPHWIDKSTNKIINNRRTRPLNHEVNDTTHKNLKKKQVTTIVNNFNIDKNNNNNNNNNNKNVPNVNRNKSDYNNNTQNNNKNIKLNNNITNNKEQFLNSKNKLLNNNNNSRNIPLRGNVRTLNASLSGSSKSKGSNFRTSPKENIKFLNNRYIGSKITTALKVSNNKQLSSNINKASLNVSNGVTSNRYQPKGFPIKQFVKKNDSRVTVSKPNERRVSGTLIIDDTTDSNKHRNTIERISESTKEFARVTHDSKDDKNSDHILNSDDNLANATFPENTSASFNRSFTLAQNTSLLTTIIEDNDENVNLEPVKLKEDATLIGKPSLKNSSFNSSDQLENKHYPKINVTTNKEKKDQNFKILKDILNNSTVNNTSKDSKENKERTDSANKSNATIEAKADNTTGTEHSLNSTDISNSSNSTDNDTHADNTPTPISVSQNVSKDVADVPNNNSLEKLNESELKPDKSRDNHTNSTSASSINSISFNASSHLLMTPGQNVEYVPENKQNESSIQKITVDTHNTATPGIQLTEKIPEEKVKPNITTVSQNETINSPNDATLSPNIENNTDQSPVEPKNMTAGQPVNPTPVPNQPVAQVTNQHLEIKLHGNDQNNKTKITPASIELQTKHPLQNQQVPQMNQSQDSGVAVQTNTALSNLEQPISQHVLGKSNQDQTNITNPPGPTPSPHSENIEITPNASLAHLITNYKVMESNNKSENLNATEHFHENSPQTKFLNKENQTGNMSENHTQQNVINSSNVVNNSQPTYISSPHETITAQAVQQLPQKNIENKVHDISPNESHGNELPSNDTKLTEVLKQNGNINTENTTFQQTQQHENTSSIDVNTTVQVPQDQNTKLNTPNDTPQELKQGVAPEKIVIKPNMSSAAITFKPLNNETNEQNNTSAINNDTNVEDNHSNSESKVEDKDKAKSNDVLKTDKADDKKQDKNNANEKRKPKKDNTDKEKEKQNKKKEESVKNKTDASLKEKESSLAVNKTNKEEVKAESGHDIEKYKENGILAEMDKDKDKDHLKTPADAKKGEGHSPEEKDEQKGANDKGKDETPKGESEKADKPHANNQNAANGANDKDKDKQPIENDEKKETDDRSKSKSLREAEAKNKKELSKEGDSKKDSSDKNKGEKPNGQDNKKGEGEKIRDNAPTDKNNAEIADDKNKEQTSKDKDDKEEKSEDKGKTQITEDKKKDQGEIKEHSTNKKNSNQANVTGADDKTKDQTPVDKDDETGANDKSKDQASKEADGKNKDKTPSEKDLTKGANDLSKDHYPNKNNTIKDGKKEIDAKNKNQSDNTKTVETAETKDLGNPTPTSKGLIHAILPTGPPTFATTTTLPTTRPTPLNHDLILEPQQCKMGICNTNGTYNFLAKGVFSILVFFMYICFYSFSCAFNFTNAF